MVYETDQCTISQIGNTTLLFASLSLSFECILRSWSLFSPLTGQIIYAMELADRAIGLLLSVISLSIFTYYTFWVIILPFVETDHFVNKYFPPQEYAILIPVFAGVTLICFLSMFIGYVMLKSKKKKAWIETMCQPYWLKLSSYFWTHSLLIWFLNAFMDGTEAILAFHWNIAKRFFSF